MSLVRAAFAVLLLASLIHPEGAMSAEKEKKPVTQYWMTVATQNMVIPGMQGESGGGLGAFGKMMGLPESGPTKTLRLQLNSPRPLPLDPRATHDIPPGQKMGETLPLLIPEHEKTRPERYEEREAPEEKVEKPKARMLIYWGCGEEVGKGQPLVIDTETISPVEFGKAFAGRSASPQYPPSERKGWLYANWPNRQSTIQVPKESSLAGSHFVHGNYSPDIKFSIGKEHDFMAPVEFTTLKGTLDESVRFEWKKIPTAIGYFATAMAHNDKTGETIFWSSSEVKETGFGLMDYLTPADVQKFIKDKVVMKPETTSCAIPKGIFKDTGGGMLQFIGYGDELNLVHPPKPKDPKEPWEPIWTAKVRLKSTGMVPLTQAEERPARRSGTKAPKETGEEQPEKVEQPQKEEDKPQDTIKKLRGIFGF